VEIGKGRQKFASYPPAIHNLSNETRFKIMESTQDAESEGRNTGSDINEADIQSYPVCDT